ncbi:MAG: hypothetical protein ACRD22_21375, partial [Terriglobia bacterium]
GLKPPTVQSIIGRSAEIELLVAQADKTALDAGKALNSGDLASLRAYTGRIARANDGAIAATHQAVISGSMAKLPAAMLTLASALSADPHIAALLGVVNALGALAQQIYSLFPENQ